MILQNVVRRLEAAKILLGHALKPGLSNSYKSTYFRSVSTLLCTVVEGFVYELVKKSTVNTGGILWEKTEHYEKQNIPASVFGTIHDCSICEKTKIKVKLTDKGVDFGKLNTYLKNNHLVTNPEYKILNSIRKERNKIHIQGLGTADTGYTKSKIDTQGKAISFLLEKIRLLP